MAFRTASATKRRDTPVGSGQSGTEGFFTIAGFFTTVAVVKRLRQVSPWHHNGAVAGSLFALCLRGVANRETADPRRTLQALPIQRSSRHLNAECILVTTGWSTAQSLLASLYKLYSCHHDDLCSTLLPATFSMIITATRCSNSNNSTTTTTTSTSNRMITNMLISSDRFLPAFVHCPAAGNKLKR